MRGVRLLVCLLVFRSSGYALVGEGVATTLAVKEQTAMQKVEYHLMKIEMVKNTKLLWDNYVQTKRYYDEAKQASQNRGGLLGYYMNKFKSRLDQGLQEEWFRLQQLKEGSEDNYVRRIVENTDANLTRQVDTTAVDTTADRYIANLDFEIGKMVTVANKATQNTNERFAVLRKLADEASKAGISDKQHDSLSLQAQVLQCEMLASIDQKQNLLFSENVRQLERDQKLIKNNQDYAQKLALALQNSLSAMEKGGRKRGKPTEGQILKVLGETPR